MKRWSMATGFLRMGSAARYPATNPCNSSDSAPNGQFHMLESAVNLWVEARAVQLQRKPRIAGAYGKGRIY